MKKNNEATIIGFKVIINNRGVLMTEIVELPDEHIKDIFIRDGDKMDVRTIIRQVKRKVGNLHKELQELLVSQ